MPLKVGDKAPDFTLFNQDAKSVSLSNYKGNNIVLLFFPFANSSVCTAEMEQIRNNYEKYNNLNASIIGVSVDSHYALKMWSEKNNFDFPLLSDFNKEVSAKYNYKGVSKRSAFVIDKEDKIRYLEICNSPANQPDYNAIEKVLNELK